MLSIGINAGIDGIFNFLISTLAIIIVLTLHTFAKAFVAVKCGDLTPKINGRVSINPLKHFDYIGLLFFVFVGFGWSKSVPINPLNFKKLKSGLAWTSLAGILCDILVAFVANGISVLLMRVPANVITPYLSIFFFYIAIYAIGYAAFNLVPLPPLDAWYFLVALKKKYGKVFRFFDAYGIFILYCLLGYHFIVNSIENFSFGYARILRYIDIFYYFQSFIINILSYPIQSFWGWIFSLWR